MADSTSDPQKGDSVDDPEESSLSKRFRSLKLEPETSHITMEIHREDLEEWNEFLQFSRNRRKWNAWREREWAEKHPPHIQNPFENFPNLHTERLNLRQLRWEDDKEAFHALSQEKNVKYYGWKKAHTTIEETRSDFIDVMLQRFKLRHSITFVITFKENDKYIGHITASNADTAVFKIVELSYLIENEYWNRGIGTEAIGRVVEFLLDDMKVHKIRATCFAKNGASKRVLEKLGFEQEGYLKDNVIIGGEYQAEYCMAKISSKDGQSLQDGE